MNNLSANIFPAAEWLSVSPRTGIIPPGSNQVISVDIDGRFGATIVEDILQLSYVKLETPDIIWASCPCIWVCFVHVSNVGMFYANR